MPRSAYVCESHWQCGGQGFESPQLHQAKDPDNGPGLFRICQIRARSLVDLGACFHDEQVERGGDGVISVTTRVLLDHGRPGAGMTDASHQLSECRAALRGPGAPCVAQVVKVETGLLRNLGAFQRGMPDPVEIATKRYAPLRANN